MNEDDAEKLIHRLQQAAMKEAEIVWSRFSSMVVANTVLAGFASNLIGKPCHKPLVIAISVLGAILNLCWFLITSYGFSLSREWWNATLKVKKKSNSKEAVESKYEPQKLFMNWQENLWLKGTIVRGFKQ